MPVDPDYKLFTVELSSFKSMYPGAYALLLKFKNSDLKYPEDGDFSF